MKYFFLMIACVVTNYGLLSQTLIPPEYYQYSQKADSLLVLKDFKNAGLAYTKAFNTIEGKGIPIDRYNAARAWAQCNFHDSAFLNLERIVYKTLYANYFHISNDTDLIPLHADKRWQKLMEAIKQNKLNSEAGFPPPDKKQLDSIYITDQKYRGMLDSVVTTFGYNSPQMDTLNTLMLETDKVNLIRVNMIFEKYGWLGPDEVGKQASTAMFMVIQHTDDIQIQEDYLPILRKAVKEGKAVGEDLALLEDRVALRQGKKQLYGSQVRRDKTTGMYYVAPIEDEMNVNIRRKSVGLEPLEIYLRHWNIDYRLPNK